MTTLEWLRVRLAAVVTAEQTYAKEYTPEAREARLRVLQEIELTARLRHELGGLDVFMSGRGADIRSTDPALEIQVKFPGYWHGPNKKPQPVDVKEVDKDLRWLLEPAAGSRALVLFLPQRLLGYGVQHAGGKREPGRRRFQHTFSARDDALAKVPNCALLIRALSEEVTHKKTDGTFSVFRQYRNDIKYDQVLDSRFHIVTVGNPDADLVWAITLMPVK